MVLLAGATCGQQSLKQRNTRLKRFLSRVIDATPNVVELLRTARYRNHVARLNSQVEGGRIAEVVWLTGRAITQDKHASTIVSQLRFSQNNVKRHLLASQESRAGIHDEPSHHH